MMSARNSGKRVVVAIVSFTVGSIGVAAIWLPFYADRDKLRGFSEEEEGMSQQEKRRYENYLRQLQQGNDRPGNSMWAGMKNQPPPEKRN